MHIKKKETTGKRTRTHREKNLPGGNDAHCQKKKQ